MHTIYDQNYAELSPEAAALYRGLGLLCVPTFPAAVAAVLVDRDEDACEPFVAELLALRLIEEVGENRLQPCNREHAKAKAEDIDYVERMELLRQVIGWYLARAALADREVLPGRERMGPAAEAARQEPAAFTSAREALDWLEAELPDLMAILRTARDAGFHEEAWQLCEALWGLFVSRRTYPERVDAGEIGLAAACACGDKRAKARMNVQLGAALVDRDRLSEAEAYFSQALSLARETGSGLGVASAVNQLGLMCLVDGRPDDAIPYFTESRDLHTAAGSPRGAALVTRRLAEAHRNASRYGAAFAFFRDAIVRFTELGDQYNLLTCYVGLAETHILAGEPLRALEPLDRAQEIDRTEGATYHMARMHLARADAHHALGDPASERTALIEALPLIEQVHNPTDAVRDRLRNLDHGATSDPTFRKLPSR